VRFTGGNRPDFGFIQLIEDISMNSARLDKTNPGDGVQKSLPIIIITISTLVAILGSKALTF
jgi:hypothetical protein